jgi:hypothetical protein
VQGTCLVTGDAIWIYQPTLAVTVADSQATPAKYTVVSDTIASQITGTGGALRLGRDRRSGSVFR